MTAETTREVVITARLSAVDLYFQQIEQLMFDLSVWRCNSELQVRGRLRGLCSILHCARLTSFDGCILELLIAAALANSRVRLLWLLQRWSEQYLGANYWMALLFTPGAMQHTPSANKSGSRLM